MQVENSQPASWKVQLLAFSFFIAGAIILSSLFRGIVSPCWNLLAQTLPRLSLLWQVRGATVLPPLALLITQSCSLVLAWVSLAFIAYRVVVPIYLPKKLGSPSFAQAQIVVPGMEFAEFSLAQVSAREKLLSDTVHQEDEDWKNPEDSYFEDADFSTPHATLAVGARSTPGVERRHELNTDRLFVQHWVRSLHERQTPCGLFMIADGNSVFMKGQEISRLATQIISSRVIPPLVAGMEDERQVENLLIDSVRSANDALCSLDEVQASPPPIAFTVALILGGKVFMAQVGECRSYLYHGDGDYLAPLHEHHTRMLKFAGADSTYIPLHAEVLVLGDGSLLPVTIFSFPFQKDDGLLLCSDGLWDVLTEQTIEEILRQEDSDLAQVADTLVELAAQGGAKDNISVIVTRLL